MLTSLDDLTIHQIPYSMDHVQDRNPRWFDKLWFHLGSADGRLSVAGHMGVYPATNSMDAAAAIAFGGKQYNVRFARELDGDRDRRTVGGIAADIVDPFRCWRFTLKADERSEVAFELEFTSDHQPMEVSAPVFHRQDGRNIIWDMWHYAQLGRAGGTVNVGGERIVLSPQTSTGARDRSWGVRPIFGQIPTLGRVPQSIAARSFWLACEFATYSLWFWQLEPANSARAQLTGNLADQTGRTRLDGAIAGTHGAEQPARIISLSRELEFAQNGSTLTRGNVAVGDWNGVTRQLEITPLTTLYSAGLGYGHPQFRHVEFKGRDVVQAETIDTSDADQAALMLRNESGHINPFGVEHFCEVRCAGEIGYGVVRLSI